MAHFGYEKDIDAQINKIYGFVSGDYKNQGDRVSLEEIKYEAERRYKEIIKSSISFSETSPFHIHPEVMYNGFEWNNFKPLIERPKTVYGAPIDSIYGERTL